MQICNCLKPFLHRCKSLPFDDECAEQYRQIHADLLNKGKPIGPNDTMISAIARARDAILVTHNISEFSRVPELRLEDWEVAL